MITHSPRWKPRSPVHRDPKAPPEPPPGDKAQDAAGELAGERVAAAGPGSTQEKTEMSKREKAGRKTRQKGNLEREDET